MAVKCNDNLYADGPVLNISTPDDDINNICNTFIRKTNIDVTNPTGFTTLLRYISQHINIDNSDINTMDYYFNIYTYIASQCKIVPDILAYSTMIGISINTIKDWESGENRSNTHTPVVKKWYEFCKSACVSGAAAGNVGCIYISKSVYGMSEQMRPTYQQINHIYTNELPPPNSIVNKYLTDTSEIIDVPDSG